MFTAAHYRRDSSEFESHQMDYLVKQKINTFRGTQQKFCTSHNVQNMIKITKLQRNRKM